MAPGAGAVHSPSMKRTRPYWLGATIAAVYMQTSPAKAQEVDGALQFGLGASLFGITDTTQETTANDQTTETDLESLEWGIGPSATWLEAGYGSAPLVLGGFLQFGGRSEDNAGGLSNDRSLLLIGPKLDFHLGSGNFRPFIGGMLGLARYDSTVELDLDNGEVRDEYSALGYFLGGRIGGRWFVTSELSLDPSLTISYGSVSGDGEGTLQLGALAATGDDQRDISNFSLRIGLAASLWL